MTRKLNKLINLSPLNYQCWQHKLMFKLSKGVNLFDVSNNKQLSIIGDLFKSNCNLAKVDEKFTHLIDKN